MAERDGDFFCRGFAVMHGPARHQPGRNVQRLRFDFVDQRLTLARAAAQHRVDEAGIFRGAPVRLHQTHRQVDRGVIGHVHPENLRGADQERALRTRRIGGNAAVQQPGQHVPQRSQPPKDGRHQPPHQGAVAVGQRLQPGMGGGAVELVVERAALVQHAVENIRRDPPRRETGHLGGRCESYRRHEGANRFRSGGNSMRAVDEDNTYAMRICQM